MDTGDRLNQLIATVRDAKAVPMSSSCLLNRAEVLRHLGQLRDALPVVADPAHAVSDRETVLADTREEAGRILDKARHERDDLIEQTDLLVAARARAAAVALESQAESVRLMADADDYVDRKLAEFDVLLTQLASQVNNGRLRLNARRGDDLGGHEGTGQAAPYTTAPARDGRLQRADRPGGADVLDPAFG